MDSFGTPMKEPQLSPRLRSVVDSFSSSVSPAYWFYGELSVYDTFGLDASAFTCHGEDIIRAGRLLAASAVPGSAIPQAEPSSSAAIDSPFFKQKKFHCQIWEPAPVKEDSSAKSSEKRALRAEAVALLSRMDRDCRERFLPGVTTDLQQSVSEDLLIKSIEGKGGAGTLRKARSAVDRFVTWKETNWGLKKPSAAILALFLMSSMIVDDDDGHVSQSLISGLAFAIDQLKFDWQLPAATRSLAKPPKGVPKQAPSASVRLVYHFWQKAASSELPMALRGVSACFYVMCVAALRGIDAQRSAVDEKELGGSSSMPFFTAFAYDSKARVTMPWACPCKAFHSDTSWLEPLFHVWGDNDFMFPAVPRGATLGSDPAFTDARASDYFVLKYLREILRLPSVSLSEGDAAMVRRHSMRHWIANAIRILKFPISDAFTGGRWKEMKIMPLRYSQETKFVTAVDVIRRVLARCEEALAKVPIKRWPVFGGWELLMEGDHTEFAPDVNLTVTPEEDEGGGDSDACDSGDESTEAAPPERVAAQALEVYPKALPPGWTKHVSTTPSGREIPHFYGPGGEYRRSLKQAWILHVAGGGSLESPVDPVSQFADGACNRSGEAASGAEDVNPSLTYNWSGEAASGSEDVNVFLRGDLSEFWGSQEGIYPNFAANNGQNKEATVVEESMAQAPACAPGPSSDGGLPSGEIQIHGGDTVPEGATDMPKSRLMKQIEMSWRDGTPSHFQAGLPEKRLRK